MDSIGMDPHQTLVHLKHDPDGTLPATLAETHLTQGIAMWTSALAELSNSSPSQIDWLIAI